MKAYNLILQGDSATLENAQLFALDGAALDQAGTRYIEQSYRHSRYVETINNIEIWYDYAADYYYFLNPLEV
jgi:hypothetical protein